MILRFKNILEIFFYKFLKITLRTIFKREGDVLPAHVLRKLDKNIFDDFSKDIASCDIPIIIITGTNGKTTTSNLISCALKDSGKKVCTNSNGANMPNGIFGSIFSSYKLTLKFDADFIVLEVDEKVFPFIVSRLKPDVVVVVNFYRDQLDRYGEINLTVDTINNAVKGLPCLPLLVLPSYEPLAAFIGYKFGNVRFYGFGKNFFNGRKNIIKTAHSDSSDALTCPNCGHILFYENTSSKSMFLLKFSCQHCGFESMEPAVYAHESQESNNKSLNGLYNKNTGRVFYFKPSLPGDYNMANYMAAYSVLKNYKLNDDKIRHAFENFRTKFGRSYKIFLREIEFNIDLVKNPTGFNRVLEKICSEDYPLNILFAFSDRDADGRDVSWIWDVDFESYVGKFGNIVITGTRPFDMAIRLRTAGIKEENITVDHNLRSSFKRIAEICKNGSVKNKKILFYPLILSF